ncbi:MAG: ATP-dependent Clp protease adaptor ClpS [Armatimonadaceae bacterium]
MPTILEPPVKDPIEIDEPGTLDLPKPEDFEDIRDSADIQGPWIVILYNCDCHTFEEVEYILQKATGCSLEKAEAIAWEVHTKGRSVCYSGSFEECQKVVQIIASIRLQVEMDRA